MNNEYVSDASDSQEEEEEDEPQIRNILVELSKTIPSQKTVDFLHSLATSKNILFWTPKGEMVYHDRRIPVTNIAQLIEYVLLPYSQDVVKPRALNIFLEGLAELKIDKSLIKNKKLVMDIIDREKENNRSEESDWSDSESEEDSSQTELEEGEVEDKSETGNEVSHENESTEQETDSPCPSCENNMTITSLQTCPYCKWQDAVKGSMFRNKALVCDICQHNNPANSRSVRETHHRCNRCGFKSHWRQRNQVRHDYYPSDGEEEN